jgi:hypothetical protein
MENRKAAVIAELVKQFAEQIADMVGEDGEVEDGDFFLSYNAGIEVVCRDVCVVLPGETLEDIEARREAAYEQE